MGVDRRSSFSLARNALCHLHFESVFCSVISLVHNYVGSKYQFNRVMHLSIFNCLFFPLSVLLFWLSFFFFFPP